MDKKRKCVYIHKMKLELREIAIMKNLQKNKKSLATKKCILALQLRHI